MVCWVALPMLAGLHCHLGCAVTYIHRMLPLPPSSKPQMAQVNTSSLFVADAGCSHSQQ